MYDRMASPFRMWISASVIWGLAGLSMLVFVPSDAAARSGAGSHKDKDAGKDRCGKLAMVERWYGQFRFGISTTVRYGSAAWEHTYDWNVTGRVELKPAMDQDSGRRMTGSWYGPAQVDVSAKEKDVTGTGVEQMVLVSQRGALREDDSRASLSLDCRGGTYELSLGAGTFDMDRTFEMSPAAGDVCAMAPQDRTGGAGLLCALMLRKKKEIENNKERFSVSLTVEKQAFDPEHAVLSGSTRVRTNRSAIDARPLEVDVSWSLSPTPPQPAQLVIEPVDEKGYESWLPMPRREDFPGVEMDEPRPLLVRARLRPERKGGPVPKGQLEILLDEVSKHEGRCNNYPRGVATKQDLRFAEKQPPGVILEGERVARSSEDVSELVVALEATDTGAHGKLKARCQSLSLTAEHPATGRFYLSVPMDLDNNNVPDSWERQNNVPRSQQLAWDEDPRPAGQDIAGDGISLYREYRGFVVLEDGKKVFRRTDPLQKDIFVIDDGGIFDTRLWHKASGITAHKVDDALVLGGKHEDQSRIVDYTMGPVSGQHKYAVRVLTVMGMDDTDCPQPHVMGCAGSSLPVKGKPPCEAGRCTPRHNAFAKVFVTRIRSTIEWLERWAMAALRWPDSVQGKMLAKSGLPRWLVERALEKMGDSTKEELVRSYVALVALHEVGHACGLLDHPMQDGKAMGDAVCPMRYLDRSDTPPITVLQTLFRLDAELPHKVSHFCRGGTAAPQDCFRRLNVKD